MVRHIQKPKMIMLLVITIGCIGDFVVHYSTYGTKDVLMMVMLIALLAFSLIPEKTERPPKDL